MPETAWREDLDELLRAVANPHRRRILELVWPEPHSAGELSDALGLAPASTSEHLKVLRKTGLVKLTVSGTFRICHADPARIGRLVALLGRAFPLEEEP